MQSPMKDALLAPPARLRIERLAWSATPRQVYARLQPRRSTALLESAKPMPGLAGWSYVAGPAAATLETRGGVTRLLDAAGRFLRAWRDPFDALAALLERTALPEPASRPEGLDFAGGLVGHLGYDLARYVEHLPTRASADLDVPDLRLHVADHVFAHEHASGAWHFCVVDWPWLARAEREAVHRQSLRHAADPGRDHLHRFTAGPVRPRTAPSHHCAAIARCLEYIVAGDIFQANLSHRLEAPCAGDPFGLYESMAAVNPAPFAAYLEGEDYALASASPERFLKLAQGRVEARPIKGTRPRGGDPRADAAQRAALAASEKDRAENLMIVDLMRNDLGRVARLGSVRAEPLFALEAHPSVWQMVSTVRAALRPDAGPAALLRACWPPGSMTGAPKVRAMEIIDALEPTRRGPYAGSVAYFDCGGGADLSVVIRSALVARVDGERRVMVQVGGGIVADSDPQAEWDETQAKARLILEAIGRHQGTAEPADRRALQAQGA